MNKQNYNTIEAANKRFNDFIDSVSGLYGRKLTGYGEFDREELDMPNNLENHEEQLEDYSKMFVK